MSKNKENVFLFVPNLIGYSRVLLAGLSCHYMFNAPYLSITLYVVSCLLDAVDGNVARALGQCSKFGAVLDMVTDRSTTACLLMYLATAYPQYALIFQGLISLDLSSHYMHMYSSLTSGSASHKQVSSSSNPILRLYYHNNIVLFIFCAGNELYFILLYLLHHAQKSSALSHPFDLLVQDWFDVVFEKNILNLVAFIAFPICAAKQIINVVQFINASKALASVDIEERQKSKLSKPKKN
ncbi:CDP-alcohol phosphatidyltransferase-domain-containing protein [Paraphysoderma sedebokerense]|nr:CDP-alcohol phosphatidyltransferase-domain-containing protein [Paraphysoderma sedebokerense]